MVTTSPDVSVQNPLHYGTPPHPPHGHALPLSAAEDGVDGDKLEALGYQQELSRDMSLFENFAMSFSIVSVLTGLTGLYTTGYANGGPVAIIWGWVLAVSFTMTVGLSLAEICSAYPTAGGVYYWAFELAPISYRGLAAWLAGWMNLIGQVAITAGIDSIVSQTLVQVIQLSSASDPDNVWTPDANTMFGIYVAILVVHGAINCLPISIIAKLDSISVWWHILGTVSFAIALPSLAPVHQPASFVFTQFYDNDALPNRAYTFLVGLLMSQFTLTGYDASAKAAEESRDAARTAPLGIILCIASSGAVGFVYLLSITFSVQDPDSVLDPGNVFGGTAAVPQIIWDACSSRYGVGKRAETASCLLLCVPLIAQFFCGMASVTSNSRTLYSFARDRALPPSLAWVHPTTHAPVYSIWVMVLCSIILGTPMLGSAVAFTAVTSIASIGLYISYGMPILFRLTSGRSRFVQGPINLGRMWPFINIAAVCWVCVLTALFVMPTVYPVNSQNLNYAGIMLAAVLVFALSWWFLGARRWFDGPNTKSDVWGGPRPQDPSVSAVPFITHHHDEIDLTPSAFKSRPGSRMEAKEHIHTS